MSKRHSLGLTTIAGVLAAGTIGCSELALTSPQKALPAAEKFESPLPPQLANVASSPEVTNKVVIRNIEFYGRWWSDEQLAVNFDAEAAPPKDSYLKLDRWDGSQPDAPHPDSIDVVCRIENRGSEPQEFTVSASGAFKIESYNVVTSQDKTLDEILEKRPWTRAQKIGEVITLRLEPNETRTVKFEGFPIGSVIDEYSAGKNNDLWPWKLRVSVTGKSSDNAPVARDQAMLRIVPSN